MSEVTLFVRKASGLVRSWSVFDAFIYATFSINLITLGLFIFSYAYYFEGNLAVAVVIGGAFTIFEVIVYASLISAMPRAGGDYVWQSRILGRAIGFILAVTGWWFILWLWVPLYGQMLMYEVLYAAPCDCGCQGCCAMDVWPNRLADRLPDLVRTGVCLYCCGYEMVCARAEDMLLGRHGWPVVGLRFAGIWQQ